jgi:hypothetical protein
MADFDNGLPPEGTDVTDNRVSSVNVSSSDVGDTDIRDISGVTVSSSDVDAIDIRDINGVMVSMEKSPNNNMLFIYYL